MKLNVWNHATDCAWFKKKKSGLELCKALRGFWGEDNTCKNCPFFATEDRLISFNTTERCKKKSKGANE